MRPVAIVGSALLFAFPAAAQTPQPGTPPEPSSPPASAAAPGVPVREQQPRRGEVDRREEAQFGPAVQQQRQRQRAEEDQLYNEIMRRSAPGNSGQ
ncbi:MAG TPA: hypothetical protein VN668_03725 [Stellaceae bacterium]|nr:hypothetical protein [Stellaceae bacterium]